MLFYFRHFFYAFICTIGFAFLFNTPKNVLVRGGLGGGLGWLLYVHTNNLTESIFLSAFLASLLIGLIGEIFAITNKKPITVFIVPGIVPLVPGYKLYHMMLSLLERDLNVASIHGIDALIITLAISVALTIVLSINSFRKRLMNKTYSNLIPPN